MITLLMAAVRTPCVVEAIRIAVERQKEYRNMAIREDRWTPDLDGDLSILEALLLERRRCYNTVLGYELARLVPPLLSLEEAKKLGFPIPESQEHPYGRKLDEIVRHGQPPG